MVDSQSEGENIGQSELQKKKRANYPNERINQCNDLAQMTKDVRKWLMRSAVTCWKRGYEDIAEWHEEISDEFFEYVDFYKDEALAAKTSTDLFEIIDF